MKFEVVQEWSASGNLGRRLGVRAPCSPNAGGHPQSVSWPEVKDGESLVLQTGLSAEEPAWCVLCMDVPNLQRAQHSCQPVELSDMQAKSRDGAQTFLHDGRRVPWHFLGRSSASAVISCRYR